MSHSVEHHLAVHVHDYDAEIRKFVPGYETMLEEMVAAVAEHLPRPDATILDLGAGTGSLAAQLAKAFPGARLVLLDADAAMLAQAKVRMAGFSGRVEYVEGSFGGALPSCDLAVASLSLHHLHTPREREATYRTVHERLPPGGVLVNGDAMVPEAPELERRLMKRWAAHLVAHGDTEAQAFERFKQWSWEDKYFSVERELALMRAAGFTETDVRWRGVPTCVLVARKS
jgi:tRNA (cmo5U34)-methyltransferase